MRRFVAAILVGGTLAATVYGAAASLGGIGNPDLGADDAAVPSCDTDGVNTSYSVAFDNGIRVTSVRVGGIADACRGNVVDVFLTDAGAQLAGNTAPVVDGAANDNFADVAFGPSGPLAEEVDGVHVSIR